MNRSRTRSAWAHLAVPLCLIGLTVWSRPASGQDQARDRNQGQGKTVSPGPAPLDDELDEPPLPPDEARDVLPPPGPGKLQGGRPPSGPSKLRDGEPPDDDSFGPGPADAGRQTGPERPRRPRGREDRGWSRGGGRWGGGQDRGRGEPAPPELTPEMIETVMEVLRDKLPEYHRRLEEARERRPERFEHAIARIAPVVMEYLDLRDRDPRLADTIIEEFRIEQRLRELSHRYRQEKGNAETRSELETEIASLVREQINLRFARQEGWLREFAERLERQQQRLRIERERLGEERSRIDEIVAKQVQDIRNGKVRQRFAPPESRGRGPGADDAASPRPHLRRGERGGRMEGTPTRPLDDGAEPDGARSSPGKTSPSRPVDDES